MKKLIFISLLLIANFCHAVPHKFDSTVTYETCFTPGNQCTNDVIDLIGTAKKQILVQAYYLSDPDIVNALISAHNADVDVQVILDKSQANSAATKCLVEAGVSIRIDYRPKIAHNKVIIIDNYRTLTGSFNFTHSAQFKNSENLIIINDMGLSEEYVINFFNRFRVSEPINKFLTKKRKK